MYKILEENVTKLEFDLYFVTFSRCLLKYFLEKNIK